MTNENKSIPAGSIALAQAFQGNTDIDHLAQSTSPELALVILQNLAGLELSIGKKVTPNHFVAQTIGFDNAKNLSGYLAGGTLYVPKNHPALQTSYLEQIPIFIEQGMTRSQIARRLKITQRHVRRLVAKLGLSGVSKVSRSIRRLPSPSESDFNGGLTGMPASFSTHPQQTACFVAQGVILTPIGIYSPQPKEEQK